jgi:hypothetical protein
MPFTGTHIKHLSKLQETLREASAIAKSFPIGKRNEQVLVDFLQKFIYKVSSRVHACVSWCRVVGVYNHYV